MRAIFISVPNGSTCSIETASVAVLISMCTITNHPRTLSREGRREAEMNVEKFFFIHAIFISVLGTAILSDAWGKDGHYVICKITEDYLSDQAAASVAELLPPGGNLSSYCAWADRVRFRYGWSRPLHYINTPGVCNYQYDRDCHDRKGREGRCLTGAIRNFTEQLLTYGDPSSEYNLTESLLFLAHFMGDVHQPLHVAFKDDRGGNAIKVRWYRRKSNLHRVWDSDIIKTAIKKFYGRDIDMMTNVVRMNITDGWSEEVPKWKACPGKALACANRYASESIELACDYAYKGVEQNSTLRDAYFFSRYPVVEKRLAQSGIRLAEWLNWIFADSHTGEIPKLQEA